MRYVLPVTSCWFYNNRQQDSNAHKTKILLISHMRMCYDRVYYRDWQKQTLPRRHTTHAPREKPSWGKILQRRYLDSIRSFYNRANDVVLLAGASHGRGLPDRTEPSFNTDHKTRSQNVNIIETKKFVVHRPSSIKKARITSSQHSPNDTLIIDVKVKLSLCLIC
jgi:hypothetical protein